MFSFPLAVCFALFLTLPLVFLFSPSISPPKPVPVPPLASDSPPLYAADELDDRIIFRRAAELASSERRLWKKFKLPCLNKYSCYPEEHYFPTLLSMADPKGCSHYTLTRVNWTGCFDGHPHLYLPDEVSVDLIYQLRESDLGFSHLFARKFSPGCLQPLMDMADEVIFRD
ncbi:hypothetical protein SAY86_002133 [Trapa natans]|uniref:Exostosin GT47 domain-containing protein n=1 Tax=Trapa natans TaxID=22666 RepID=A0AAN7LJR4_TRANT|nr:hypothetical protein SAY86_002133 [Trapa natans]